ncbi:MAG: hypothetical protein CMJ86_09735 [Planctomycetes bacterium]|nr:hypothetical protein [Planctomycetota bacterium]
MTRQPRTLALLIGALLAIGGAEFIARRSTSTTRHLPRTPNLTVTLHPEQGDLFGISGPSRHTTSSLGLRGPEPAPTDELHILCVGGSTTACEYLDDDETWPQLLSATFKDTPTWVGNAGLSGHRALDHVTLLGKLLNELEDLDVVVVLAGVNDLAIAAEGRDLQDPMPLSTAQLQRVFHAQPRDFSLWPPQETAISGWLQSMRAERWEVAALEDPAAGSYQTRRMVRADHLPASASMPSLDSALRSYEKHLTWICRAVTRRGIQPLLLTHPVLWGAQQEVLDERCWFGWSGAPPWKSPTAYIPLARMAEGMHAFNRSTRAVAAQENVILVDLDHLNSDPALFYDDCHFNEAGARAVAEALAETMLNSAPALFEH